MAKTPLTCRVLGHKESYGGLFQNIVCTRCGEVLYVSLIGAAGRAAFELPPQPGD